MRILVTGGAGFVGSHLALSLRAADAGSDVVAFDNLRRRGSELALPRLRQGGVRFHHGDVRAPDDLADVGPIDLLVECSAEPSVHAGYGGGGRYVVDTNLTGTVNCLEVARRHDARVVFLSTSRVYPIQPLRTLPLTRAADRFVIPADRSGPGWSEQGVSELFPLAGSRSLYGATKLASELLIEEYCAMYGLRAVVNRCGVLTGPWQMGKVDQGFVVLWAARHLYGGALAYTGFGGEGLQVRDILHVDDLHRLVVRQLARLEESGPSTFAVYNVGGGHAGSVSLRELTAHCAELTGRRVAVGTDPDTRPADVPYYVTDTAHVRVATGWAPTRSVPETVEEIVRWLTDHRAALEPLLA
jgi:CDP-paratose 2-epimerase